MEGLMRARVQVQEVEQRRERPRDEDLGFGKVFTDHMFLMDYVVGRGWYDPRIVPYGPLALPPGAAVLHYAQTIFEGLKAYATDDGRVLLFRPRENARRLNVSARRLCMPQLDGEDFVEAIRILVDFERRWVPSAEGTSLYIRPLYFATEENLSLKPSATYTFAIILSPVGSYYPRGMSPTRIFVEPEHIRAAPGGVGAAKTGGNYARCLQAEARASELGYDQVLWLDGREKRYVEEVGAMNVFFRIGDTVVTPPLTGTILPGVTRDSVLHLLEEWGVDAQVRRIPLAEIADACEAGGLQEAFGVGTAAVISPIGELRWGDMQLKISAGRTGPLTTRLYETLVGIQRGNLEDRFGWTEEVPRILA